MRVALLPPKAANSSLTSEFLIIRAVKDKSIKYRYNSSAFKSIHYFINSCMFAYNVGF